MKKIKSYVVVISLLFAAQAGLAQSYEPSIEYMSLLNMRFDAQNGFFMLQTLQTVFLPEGNPSVDFAIIDLEGKVMASVPLLIERWGSYPVFDALRPKGHPGIMSLENPGRYVMLALVNGNPITTLPFTLNVESSGDPFNPKKTFTRDGPWQSLAFFPFRLKNRIRH